MKMMHRIGMWLSLLLIAGCAGGGGHPSGSILPIATVGLHFDVYEIINSPNIAQRTSAYLDEIEASSYAKELRIVFDKENGPAVLREMIPIIRAKGFKILPILSMGNQMRPYDAASDLVWIEAALPQVLDLLVGIQLTNEPWQRRIAENTLVPFPPAEYAYWHRWITPTVRRLAPGVPIVDGDIDGGWENAMQWWQAVEKAGTLDIDALSWHVYTSEIPPAYGHAIWITEAGDAKDCVSPAVKCFVFAWNYPGRFGKRPGGGILP